jgi:hypothetical protein
MVGCYPYTCPDEHQMRQQVKNYYLQQDSYFAFANDRANMPL